MITFRYISRNASELLPVQLRKGPVLTFTIDRQLESVFFHRDGHAGKTRHWSLTPQEIENPRGHVSNFVYTVTVAGLFNSRVAVVDQTLT